jgi:hypothetical protein
MVLAAALLGCVLPQAASAEEPSASSEAVASSNKGLGPGAFVPSWAVGERVHFMAGQPAGSGLTGEPLGGSSELGRRPGTDKPLLYNGGSGVQHSPVIYVIFWGKNWEAEPGTALRKQLLKLYEGISGSTWQEMLTQYFDSTSRVSSKITVATSYIDKGVNAPTSVNDAKIRTEVAEALKAEANKTWKREASSQFVVIPAPGSTYEAGFGGFCAYHGVDASGSSYTFVPYLGEEPFKAGCVKFYEPKHENADNVDSMAASHEYAESATDPQVEPFTNATWYTKAGYEIGDLCASEGAAEEVTTGSLKGSWVQGLWDDHQSACTLSDKEPPHVYTVTEAASELKSTTAKLNGTVNPEALETKYHFEYGTTTSYGSSTSEVSAGSGVTNQAESAAITGLTAKTEYHYRLVAKNSTGTTDGEDGTFITSKPPAWSVQTTPSPTGAHSMVGVSCASASACTAVGTSFGTASSGFAETWNGSAWSLQSIAEPSGSSRLSGVSCTSANACTAVGEHTSGGKTLTLAERWNGTAWSIQETPNPTGATFSGFQRVFCSSATACTAVGYTGSESSYQTLAERWNGTSWSIQEIPHPTGAERSLLNGVSCTSATACTAAGWARVSGVFETLAENWNGTAWSIQETPNPTGATQSFLSGLSCTSANECTATGEYSTKSGTMTLAERWNGTNWSIQETPNPTTNSKLDGVSCTSAKACTAVGEDSGRGLAESWNGTTWSVQSTPDPDEKFDFLFGVSCTSSSACTAVGGYENTSSEELTLAERYE